MGEAVTEDCRNSVVLYPDVEQIDLNCELPAGHATRWHTDSPPMQSWWTDEGLDSHTYERPPDAYDPCPVCGHAALHEATNVLRCEECSGPCVTEEGWKSFGIRRPWPGRKEQRDQK